MWPRACPSATSSGCPTRRSRKPASASAAPSATGQPLNPPDSFRSLERYVTAQVPNNFTQGTSNVASDAFVGDWSQFAIGMRTSIRIEATQLGADENGLGFASLSVLVRAWMRVDFAVLQPSAFVVISGLTA